MASPVDSARQTTNITTAGTSHAINVGSPVSGTLLVVFVRFAAAPGTVTFTGYTQLVADTSDASDDDTRAYYRQADGTEGATDTLSTTSSVKLAAIAYEVTGAANPASQAPEVSAVQTGTTVANQAGTNVVIDPTGGTKDYLFIAFAGLDQEGVTFSGPSGYSNNANANSGTTGAVAANTCIGSASRQATISEEIPGAFTHGAAANGWASFCVAVHPAGPATSLLLPNRSLVLTRRY